MNLKTISKAAALSLALLTIGCARPFADWYEDEKVEVTFRTGLTGSDEPFDGSRAIGDHIKTLLVYDYVNEVKKQEVVQTQDSEDFGTVTLALANGKHDIVFIGHKTDGCSFSYPNATFPKVLDTFSFCLSLDADDAGLDLEQDVTLARQVGLVKVKAQDAVPSGAAAIRMTLSAAYPSLNVKTAHAAGDAQEVVRTFDFQASHIGMTGTTYSIYTFIPEAGMTTDVTVEVLDADGKVLNTSSAASVEVKKNRQTVLTGNIFGDALSLQIKLDTDWGDDIKGAI